MKKIITLFFAATSFVVLHAQTSKEEARRVILGQPKNTNGSGNPSTNGRDIILGGGNNGNTYPTSYPGNYPNNYPYGSREAQIDQVNREYDAKIYSIRNNGNLSPSEKERMIRQLEADRARRIREINKQSGSYNKKNKKHDDDDRYERHDNGKHKGWEKGKGNPHKGNGKGRDND
jgi:hypothetical protein